MIQATHLEKLDAVRGFTACYVVLHHLSGKLKFVPEPIKKVFLHFGQEAVIIFFLLSGFVIFLSVVKNPQLTFKDYFIKRFRRIYFPFLIAILLSIVIFYFDNELIENFRWENLLGNLLMLQDFSAVKPGTWFNPFLANYPLWSLSYEWWFYLLFFPLYKFLPKNQYRILLVLLISAFSLISYILHPNQISLWLTYFIIWWSGLEIANLWIKKETINFKSMKLIIFALTLMLILILIPILQTDNVKFGYYPFLFFRHFMAAFLTVIIGIIWYKNKFIYFAQTLGIFAKVAPISYGLYIFHYPILYYWHLETYMTNLWIVYLIKFVLIIGLAYIVEIKLQPLVNQWIK